MDLVGFSIFTLAPVILGMYFSYVFSAVKGMNRALWTIAGGFSILVPLFIFIKKVDENLTHPWSPGESAGILVRSHALLRNDPEKSRADISGYVYLLENTVRWVPSDDSQGYEWDYAYVLSLKGKRTYKDAFLTWLILPNPDNESTPFSISLGNASGVSKLNIMATLMILKNRDQELMDMVANDSKSKLFGRKGKKNEENN